ncbi:MAG: mechanosensitive ion channel family protein [Promethearchaeota archaeon]
MIDKYLLFLIITAVIYFIYRIIILLINRATKKFRFPVNAINGLKLISRLLAIFIFVIALLMTIEIPNEFLLSLTSVGGIIIGFATTEIMSQVISGIYIISTQPFGINDLIKLGNTEGLVLEIGINYTIIARIDGTIVKIPNKTILDSKVKNYTIKMTDELKTREIDEESIENIKKVEKFKNKSKLNSLLALNENLKVYYKEFSAMIYEKEITRYTFEIDVYFDAEPKVMLKKFDKICRKYKTLYGFKPKYLITDFGWRATVQFIIICKSAQTILNNQEKFVTDIANLLYSEEEK